MTNDFSDIEEIFNNGSLKMTPLRRKVLEIIHGNGCKPMKAYDILDALRSEGFSDKPPIVYRVLDFLLENKVVHKINVNNSYVICSHLAKHDNCYFLICLKCDSVAECCNKNLEKVIEETSLSNDFVRQSAVIEVKGICKKCQ